MPVLGDHPGWVQMYDFAWANEKRLILYNPKFFSPWWVDEGFGASNSIFQWDTLYGTIGNKWGFYQFPTIETQNNFYYFQLANGFMGQKLGEKNGGFNSEINPPFFAWTEWEHYLVTGDKARFTKVINGRTVLRHLVDYFNYLYNSPTYHRADGSWTWAGKFGSGRESTVDDGYARIDLISQMAAAAYYTAKIAEVAGDTAAQTAMNSAYATLVSDIDRLHWNPATGYFETLDAASHAYMTNTHSPQAFWTLIARACSPSQAAAMVAHITDPDEFWRAHPVPSVSADSSYYMSGSKWNGPTWPPDVITAEKALSFYGYWEQAHQLAWRDLDMTYQSYATSGALGENYYPDQPRIYGGTNLTWSSAAVLVGVVDFLIGLSADAPHDSLTWHMFLTEPNGMRNLHFGDNIVSVTAARRASAAGPAVVTVSTDSPFTLNVVIAGNTYSKTYPAAGTYTDTFGGSGSDTQPPTAPTGLTATAISSSRIDLSWTAATDDVGVSGYRIFRGGVQVGTCTGTSYADSGLAPSTTYAYSVKAYDAAGNVSGPSAAASATTPPDGSGNLALGRPATVSTYYSLSQNGSKAVDGDGATYWRTRKSNGGPSEWIVVDLGSAQPLSKVVLKWGGYYATKYRIEVSADNATWIPVFEDLAGNGGTDTITFSPATARYVRMYSTAWNQATERIRLFELEVYK